MTIDQHHRDSSSPPISRPPAAVPAEGVPAPRIRRFRYEPNLRTSGQDEPLPWHGSVTADVPDDPTARDAAEHLMLLVMEVLNRRRPATHLAEDAVPAVVRYVRAVIPCRGLVRLSSLHVQMPRDGAAELVAVCRVGTAHRAIAARLDRIPTRWRCTALRLL